MKRKIILSLIGVATAGFVAIAAVDNTAEQAYRQNPDENNCVADNTVSCTRTPGNPICENAEQEELHGLDSEGKCTIPLYFE